MTFKEYSNKKDSVSNIPEIVSVGVIVSLTVTVVAIVVG